MSSISDIRTYLHDTLLPGLTAGGFTLTAENIHLGHHPRSNNDDLRGELIDEGPQVVIEPGEITGYDLQLRAGMGKITFRLYFGFDPNSEQPLTSEEEFMTAFLKLVLFAVDHSPQNCKSERIKIDQELAGIIEYKIIALNYILC